MTISPMTDTVRKQQCRVARQAFAGVYHDTGEEQYHVITLHEINVALAAKGLPAFQDKQELEDAMLSELVAAAKDPKAVEEIVRCWVQNAVLD